HGRSCGCSLSLSTCSGIHQKGEQMTVPYSIPTAIKHLRRDAAMAKLIGALGPPKLRLQRGGSHMHYLQRAIIYQQLSGKAAATIHRRYLDLFGGRAPDASKLSGTSDAALK